MVCSPADHRLNEIDIQPVAGGQPYCRSVSGVTSKISTLLNLLPGSQGFGDSEKIGPYAVVAYSTDRGAIVVRPVKAEGLSGGTEAFAFDGGGVPVGALQVEKGVGEQDEMPVRNDGALGADLVLVQIGKIFQLAKEFLDLPAQREAPDDLVGREGQAVCDEDVGPTRVPVVPRAEGDDDLLLARKAP